MNFNVRAAPGVKGELNTLVIQTFMKFVAGRIMKVESCWREGKFLSNLLEREMDHDEPASQLRDSDWIDVTFLLLDVLASKVNIFVLVTLVTPHQFDQCSPVH